MTNTSNLLLFTSKFPFGNGEQFLESELPILCKRFKRVVLIPYWPEGPQREVPENCLVVPLLDRFELKGRFRNLILRYALPLIRCILILLIKSPKRFYYIKKLRSTITDLSIIMDEGECYLEKLKVYLNEASVLYFYWFDKPFIHFALLKERKRIEHLLISRGLGYDYDPIRNELGFYLYREIELKHLHKLLLNSEWGKSLMSDMHPPYKEKFERSYLGLINHPFTNPINQSGVFQLVSCSYVIDLKRVELIVDILRHINFPLHWTHLGEGPLLEEVKLKAQELPLNISTNFPGYVDSVMEHYRTKPVDLFLTTTFTEGLPFTLMESISFGIPVMGTKVCGIPEVANGNTGFLIPLDFDPKQTAEMITDFKNWPKDKVQSLRTSAKAFYEEVFVSEKNTNQFIDRYLLS